MKSSGSQQKGTGSVPPGVAQVVTCVPLPHEVTASCTSDGRAGDRKEHSSRLFSTDAERLEFLTDLDNCNEVEVGDWEARFIESALRYQTGAILFSDKQRTAIDRMFDRYAGLVYSRGGASVPASRGSSVASPHRLPGSVRGQCAFLVERGTRRCGEPATQRNSLGLELCDTHFAERQEAIRRQKEWKERQRR